MPWQDRYQPVLETDEFAESAREPTRLSEVRDRMVVDYLQADPERAEYVERLSPEHRGDVVDEGRERLTEAFPDAFRVRSGTREVRRQAPARAARAEFGMDPSPKEEVEEQPVYRPLYDPGTEAFLKEWKEDPSVVDWSQADQADVEGMTSLLMQAFPDEKDRIMGPARQRAKEILDERGVRLFPEAEDEAHGVRVKEADVRKLFAQEFTRRFLDFAGAAGAGPLTDLAQAAMERPVVSAGTGARGIPVEREDAPETPEAREVMNRLTALSADNRRLSALAYGDDTALLKAAGTGMGWMGGANAFFRGSLGTRRAPMLDERGAKVLDRAGEQVMRNAPWKIDPISRRGLVAGLAPDAAAGAFYGPEYGPNLVAEMFGADPSRATTAGESAAIGVVAGTVLRSIAQAGKMNRIREMPEFADIPAGVEDAMFEAMARAKTSRMWEMARRRYAHAGGKRDMRDVFGEVRAEAAQAARRGEDFTRPSEAPGPARPAEARAELPETGRAPADEPGAPAARAPEPEGPAATFEGFTEGLRGQQEALYRLTRAAEGRAAGEAVTRDDLRRMGEPVPETPALPEPAPRRAPEGRPPPPGTEEPIRMGPEVEGDELAEITRQIREVRQSEAMDPMEQTRTLLDLENRQIEAFKAVVPEGSTFEAPALPGRGDRGVRVIISPNTTEPGSWRYTLVDQSGPAADGVRESWEKVVRDVVRDYGADLSQARTPEGRPAEAGPEAGARPAEAAAPPAPSEARVEELRARAVELHPTFAAQESAQFYQRPEFTAAFREVADSPYGRRAIARFEEGDHPPGLVAVRESLAIRLRSRTVKELWNRGDVDIPREVLRMEVGSRALPVYDRAAASAEVDERIRALPVQKRLKEQKDFVRAELKRIRKRLKDEEPESWDASVIEIDVPGNGIYRIAPSAFEAFAKRFEKDFRTNIPPPGPARGRAPRPRPGVSAKPMDQAARKRALDSLVKSAERRGKGAEYGELGRAGEITVATDGMMMMGIKGVGAGGSPKWFQQAPKVVNAVDWSEGSIRYRRQPDFTMDTEEALTMARSSRLMGPEAGEAWTIIHTDGDNLGMRSWVGAGQKDFYVSETVDPNSLGVAAVAAGPLEEMLETARRLGIARVDVFNDVDGAAGPFLIGFGEEGFGQVLAKGPEVLQRVRPDPGRGTAAAGDAARPPAGADADIGGALGPPPERPGPGRAAASNEALVIELPEIVRLATELMEGRWPRVLERVGRRDTVRGMFRARGPGEIELRADLFNLVTEAEKAGLREEAMRYARGLAEAGEIPRDQVRSVAEARYRSLLEELYEERKKQHPDAAAKTLAHEVGHLVDYLPDQVMARGNLLGRIGKLKSSMKHFLPLDPNKPVGQALKGEDYDAIRTEAERQLMEELGGLQEIVREIIEEVPVYRTLGISPDDVRGLLGMDARETMPHLYEWFARQPAQVKKEILRAALQGVVDERVAAQTGRSEQIGTRQVKRTVRERMGRDPTPEEIEQRFRDLLREEIRRRNLVELQAVRKELIELSYWWRPLPEGVPIPESFLRYRESAAELYADAFSVLVNSPKELAARAPLFYEAFFGHLGRNPPVKKLYEQLQDDIKSGRVHHERVRDLRESFARADERGITLEEMSGRLPFSEWADWFRLHFDRTFGPIIRRTEGVLEKGDFDSLQSAIEQYKYRSTKHEAILRQIKLTALDPLRRENLDFADFGEYVFHQHVVNNRYDIANPRGWTAKASQERLDAMRADLGPDRFEAVQGAQQALRRAYEEHVIEPLRAMEILDEGLQELLERNFWYATIKPARELPEDPNTIEGALAARYGNTVGAAIHPARGYLGDVTNPVTATMQKALSLISMAHRNFTARKVVEALGQAEEPIMKPAEMTWVSRGKRRPGYRQPKRVETDRIGTLTYLHQGQIRSYYVPRAIKEIFETGDELQHGLLAPLYAVTHHTKGLFTAYNPGFWPWSLYWDSWGYINRMPKARAFFGDRAYIKYFPRAAVAAHRATRGKPDAVADEALKRGVFISRAYYRGEIVPGQTQEERLMLQYGLEPELSREGVNTVQKLRRAFRHGFLWWTSWGQIQERIPKIAGMMYLDDHFSTTSTAVREGRWAALGESEKIKMIHEHAGSPDYLQKGRSAVVVDTLWSLFFNPMKEGVRSKVRHFKHRPAEAVAKFLAYTAPPTLVLWMLENGYFNESLEQMLGPLAGEEMEEMLRAIPEREKGNHHIIPLGWYNREEKKVLFARLPLEPNERALNASLRWFLTTGQGGEHLLQHFGDAMPGAGLGDNPFLKIGSAWWDYMIRGENPYDNFYGREVLTQDQMDAREGTVPLLKWSWNQIGGSLVGRMDTAERPYDLDPEGLERFLGAPVVQPTLGRWLRISNRGYFDEARQVGEEVRQHRAQLRIAGREVMKRILDKEPLADSHRELYEQEPYLREYLHTQSPEMMRMRGLRDPEWQAIMQAPSVEERIRVMRHFRERRGRREAEESAPAR